MKRSLVIGCAAVALAAGCGTASAQSKFDVILGGDAFFQGAYVDQDNDNNLRKTEFANRFRLTVTPTAKADNGLEYGARLRLRAAGTTSSGNNRTTDADRAYIFVNGTFGSVQAGVTNGPSDDTGVISPNVDGISGSPDGFYANYYGVTSLPYVTGSLRTLESGDASTKIVYSTPSFAGFKLSAAYTPTYGSSNTDVNRRKNVTYNDMGEVQAYYKGAFSGVGLEASVAYQFAQAPTGFEDLSSVHTGATVSFGPFAIGGSYAFSGDSGYRKGHTGVDDNQVWLVGAQYTVGPLILAATYTDAKGANVGTGAFTAADYARAHIYQGGVTYTVAPGLTTGLEYSYVDNKSGGVNNDANIVLWDTRFSF
ncbi:porin [Azospirillum sp. YIM B02556]|uniref:Porin n=1 Tax=Azospirillum endophyticum TaxID=2800326 RepID=A0ABS1FF11_9PROT|nr:porin [Azospirillum endophyticum]MBK1842023.1 porin [Azospirillum endophyticum]